MKIWMYAVEIVRVLVGWCRQNIRRRRPRTLCMERLDVRAYCAAITSANGVVRITATDASDHVVVHQSSTHFTVSINGETHSVARAGVKRIDAFLLSGHDTYDGRRVVIPQRVFGDSGNDRIHGGSSNDRLYGMIGSDSVIGYAGRDEVNGGPGVDWLYGSAGADLYVANDNGVPDRLIGVMAEDTVRGDVLGTIGPVHSLNDKTNKINFYGNHIELRRATIPGVDGIFYRAHLNGRQYGDVWRAAGVISLFTPRSGGSVTIDPQLRSELDGRGWLNIESLA